MSVHDYEARTIDGQPKKLGDYSGQVLLVVNVASKCGLTPQYEGLEALYRKFKDKGFSILGFPCDQFGHQEPGTEEEIQSFCSLTYDVSFPMFAKIKVNGDDAHPIYKYLKAEKPGVLGTEGIKWNFTKFLIGKNGEVVQRYAPTTKPDAIEKDVAALLGSS